MENMIPFTDKPSVDDIQKEVDHYEDKHDDEHKIAEKLNIPLTTVIRNYDAYKSIYDTTLKKEQDIEKDNFFNLNIE